MAFDPHSPRKLYFSPAGSTAGLDPYYPLRLYFLLEPDDDEVSFFAERPLGSYVVYQQVVSDILAAKYQLADVAENAGKTAGIPESVYVEKDFGQISYFAL
jgi:hypothetical protein